MKAFLSLLLAAHFCGQAIAQNLAPMKSNQPYIENGHERHVLDIYAPPNASNLPVLFWIHGGGFIVITASGNAKTNASAASKT
jgi:carboxylesterase type B